MAMKPNFKRKQKRRVHGATFWDAEYTNPSHLKLSETESGDLAKFMRWVARQDREDIPPEAAAAIDVGCGNGRNLIYLAREYGVPGTGIDISSAAIKQARAHSTDLPITYHVGSAGAPLPVADESQTLALDMMTSHFLNSAERTALREELYRVLMPGGYLFLKTFLKDDDLHTERLLKEHPGPEPGTYIHPVMGVPEYVYDEATLRSFLSERFLIHKVYRSHQHRFRGRARKRRTIAVYAQKDFR